MLKKIIGAIRNPVRIIQFCSRRGWLNWMSDEKYLKLVYKLKMGRKLNLENPKAYSEKLQWIKLYDRNPKYTMLVDKYEVRNYVKEVLGEEYLIPLLGVWDSAKDIDYDSLPEQFVLKCTHDSGSVIVCKNKSTFDKKAAEKKLSRCLKNNGYGFGREWPYKNVKPRIIAEQYMEDKLSSELRDYKFYCFSGEVKFVLVASERFSEKGVCFDYLDTNYNKLPIVWGGPNSDALPPKPAMFEEMLVLAKKMCQGHPHVRVDLYSCNSKIYFGEMTFFDSSGFVKSEPEEWEIELGDSIILPPKTV